MFIIGNLGKIHSENFQKRALEPNSPSTPVKQNYSSTPSPSGEKHFWITGFAHLVCCLYKVMCIAYKRIERIRFFETYSCTLLCYYHFYRRIFSFINQCKAVVIVCFRKRIKKSLRNLYLNLQIKVRKLVYFNFLFFLQFVPIWYICHTKTLVLG